MSDFKFSISDFSGSVPSEEEQKGLPKGKKRKNDVDVFVCHSTPTIPESSSLDINQEEDSESRQPVLAQSGQLPSTKDTESCYFQGGSYHDDREPNPEGAALQAVNKHNLVNQLFQSFQQQSLSLLEQWSHVFRQSEEFEMQCPDQLDRYMEEARCLNDTMVSQKNALCQRVQGIGQALQN